MTIKRCVAGSPNTCGRAADYSIRYKKAWDSWDLTRGTWGSWLIPLHYCEDHIDNAITTRIRMDVIIETRIERL